MVENGSKSELSRFIAEARRRRVVRFAVGYAAATFVALQLAEILFPAFGIGEGGLRVLVVVVCLAFPPALVLAWLYDVTREGIRRTDDRPAIGQPPSRLAAAALVATTLVATAGAGLYLADQGVLSPDAGSAAGDAEDAVRPPGSTTSDVTTAAYTPGDPIRSLAVLPLDDYSPDANQAYFTLGMHEELIAKLSLLEDVRVVSRTTVMRYADPATRPTAPELGRALNVEALVEGSVSRSGDLVRVTLQIIHAPSDSHIGTLQWGPEPVDDVLGFQTEIAQAVAAQISSENRQRLETAATASVEPGAQEAYLRARHELAQGTPEAHQLALQHFLDAVEEDPDFAAAMAGAAGARFVMSLDRGDSASDVADQIALARQEALSALEMDSTSMEAKEILALIDRSVPVIVSDPSLAGIPLGDRTASIRIEGLGNELDSISVDARAMDTTWVDAITALGERIESRVRARALDVRELGPQGRAMVEAGLLVNAGRYRDAERVLEGLVDDDADFLPAWDLLVRARVASGDLDDAVATVARWSRESPGTAPEPLAVARLATAVEEDGVHGFWAWRLDRLLTRQENGREIPQVELAAAYAGIGDEVRALAHLERALARAEPGLLSLRSDPVWDDLRRDRRFRQLARAAQSLRFAPIRRGSDPRSTPSGR